MAGRTTRFLEKITYDKLGASLVMNTSVSIWVATNLPVDGYVYGGLVLRVHSFPIVTGTPSIALQAFPSAPTAEDPVTTFRGANPVTNLDMITSGKYTYGSPNPPAIAVTGGSMLGTVPAGSFIDILLTVTQGASSNAAMTFTISADLVLRS